MFCVEVGNVTTQGSNMIQWSWNGGSPQRWTMTKIG